MPISAAAAGLPQIPRLTGEARSYAERLFDFPTIASLDPHAATTALVAPARAHGIGYEDDAIEFALEWTKGYPFYIQQIGKHAWNRAANSPITRADIEDALPAAQAALDRAIYEVRVQRATANERGLRLHRFQRAAIRRVHAQAHAISSSTPKARTLSQRDRQMIRVA